MANDILLDEDGDLKIVNGDLALGNAEAQHVDDLVFSFKGEYKEFPLLGAEAQRRLKQRQSLTKLKKAVRKELEDDGYQDVTVVIQENDIQINAERIG